jgi:spore maturation protein A
MLNYIWAGLIIFSLVFALGNDLFDLKRDTYRNGQSLPIVIESVGGTGATAGGGGPAASGDVTVRIDPKAYAGFYGVAETLPATYTAKLTQTSRGTELRFAPAATLPPRLAKIRDMTSADDPKWLLARVTDQKPDGSASIQFQAVRWVSIQAIGDAAIKFAQTAVELALKLISTLCLFLGIMQIAEKSGLIHLVVLVTGPILRPLFPGIPRGHPAMGMVTLNLTANMLGLGNAATPFGIKAMEELQKLNKSADTATNEMVMLLAMNTAGVQLLPPIFLYAVMGLRASELYIPIVIVTGLCLVIAISAVKLLGRLPGYRASDPDLLPEPGIANVVTAEVAK